MLDRLTRLNTRLRAASGHAKTNARADDKFEEFLLAEYENIAQAHFNTVDALANFVKQYILLASIPATVAIFLFSATDLKLGDFGKVFEKSIYLAPVVMTVIAAVGCCVLGYMVNIRCDTLLYARTVNGIRNYFYARSGIGLSEEINVRTLPRDAGAPLYLERSYFLFVVLAFTLLDTSYVGAGWYYFWDHPATPAFPWLGWWAIIFASTVVHLTLYFWLCAHRERYRRAHIVGVDIDGVLNAHREHFCKYLKQLTGKVLGPASIVRIPVHEIPGTDVTASDEDAVFNNAGYWRTPRLTASRNASGPYR